MRCSYPEAALPSRDLWGRPVSVLNHTRHSVATDNARADVRKAKRQVALGFALLSIGSYATTLWCWLSNKPMAATVAVIASCVSLGAALLLAWSARNRSLRA